MGFFFFPLCFLIEIETLTAQVCMWAWSRDECTAWNGRHGRRGRPGSPGTRAGRPRGEAGSPCRLQERGRRDERGERLVVLNNSS